MINITKKFLFMNPQFMAKNVKRNETARKKPTNGTSRFHARVIFYLIFVAEIARYLTTGYDHRREHKENVLISEGDSLP